ncbi:MFS transporter, partial [Pseudomonas aeruginosa]
CWNMMLIVCTTLLGGGHAESERGTLQGLRERGNSLVAALMSFGSGALITSLSWNAVNLLVRPALLVALALLWPVRRTR